MGTLAYFPTLYPDEDFRSVVWRYHVRSGNKSLQDTNKDLFNFPTNRNLFLPRNLSFLLGKLPYGHEITLQKILDGHTLYSLCKLVLSEEQNCQLLRQIASHDEALGNTLFERVKLVVAPVIRYCPLCMKEDAQNYGECYVHRIHQVQFLHICTKHRVRLTTCCGTCQEQYSSSTGDNLTTTTICSQGHTPSIDRKLLSSEELTVEMQLLEDAQVLIGSSEYMNRSEIMRKFQAALWDKGYIDLFGRINKIKFHSDFDAVTKRTFPTLIPWINSSKKRETFRKEWRIPSLLTYIALMRFLSAGSVNDFIERSYECSVPRPFGSGPWVCLNPVCPETGKPVITSCNRTLKKRKFIGHFRCSNCGYTYVRSIAIRDVRQQCYTHSVRTRGKVWETSLVQLRNSGLAWADIAKIFEITPRSAEKSFYQILKAERVIYKSNLAQDETNVQVAFSEILQGAEEIATSQHIVYDACLKSKRERLLQVISQYPDLFRSEIHKKNPKNYEWLKKHDKGWLEEVLPPPKTHSHPRIGTRLDWAQVDRQLSLKVEEEARILYRLSPNGRIRPYSIISRLTKTDGRRLSKIPRERLPKSWEMLRKYTESDVEYQLRRREGKTK
jgi:predicted RNA-binding Zn-ribbon protein involved in translation (DUF1610 family)